MGLGHQQVVWENVCGIHTWTRTSKNDLDQDFVMRENSLGNFTAYLGMVWGNCF